MSEYTPISDERYFDLLNQLRILREALYGILHLDKIGKKEAIPYLNKQIFDLEVILCKAGRSAYPGSNYYPEAVCLAAGARLMSRLEAYEMGYGGVLREFPTRVMVYPEGHPFNEKAHKSMEFKPVSVPIRGNGGVLVTFNQEDNTITSIGKISWDLSEAPLSYLVPVE